MTHQTEPFLGAASLDSSTLYMTDIDEDGYGDSYPSIHRLQVVGAMTQTLYLSWCASTLSSLIWQKDEDGDGYATAVAGKM